MANKWEHDQYDDAFEAIKLVAKAKMVMNYHKGDIADIDRNRIIGMMKDEMEELESAISQKHLMNIIEEAADVYNFLVALVHQKIQEYRGRKQLPLPLAKIPPVCLKHGGSNGNMAEDGLCDVCEKRGIWSDQ